MEQETLVCQGLVTWADLAALVTLTGPPLLATVTSVAQDLEILDEVVLYHHQLAAVAR